MTVSWPQEIHPDPDTVTLLQQCNIDCRPLIDPAETFDIVLDCTGQHRQNVSRCGYIELTRSGAMLYARNPDKNWINVDGSRIKKVETILGTPDGFIRSLRQLGLDQLDGKPCLVFGFGKVGKGITASLKHQGAIVTVTDFPGTFSSNNNFDFIDCRQINRVMQAVQKTHLIVTATGVENLISQQYPVEDFINSKAILANMGAQDEYGDAIPKARVLNQRLPLNFILQEPTQMKYIDPIMTLYSACGLYMLEAAESGQLSTGMQLPPEKLEQKILDCFFIQHGIPSNIQKGLLAEYRYTL
ncbi:Rossmann-fold NAD(P)-binding domain-containing protein [Spongorhabdus nitratireducens]